MHHPLSLNIIRMKYPLKCREFPVLVEKSPKGVNELCYNKGELP